MSTPTIDLLKTSFEGDYETHKNSMANELYSFEQELSTIASNINNMRTQNHGHIVDPYNTLDTYKRAMELIVSKLLAGFSNPTAALFFCKKEVDAWNVSQDAYSQEEAIYYELLEQYLNKES